MKDELIDIPFVSPPIMRVILRILESHQEGDITIIDKAEVESIYVITKDSRIKDVSLLGEKDE